MGATLAQVVARFQQENLATPVAKSNGLTRLETRGHSIPGI